MLAPEQIELQEKITLIQELDAVRRWMVNDLDTNARERYREHIENAQLSSAFSAEVGLLLCLWHYLVHATPVSLSIPKY